MVDQRWLQALAGAGNLPSPTGPVVLTVSGRIANTNAGKTAEFDLAMLEALARPDGQGEHALG